MKRILLSGIFALVGVLSFSAKSDAAFKMIIDSGTTLGAPIPTGTTYFNFADNTPGSDGNSTLGVIQLSYPSNPYFSTINVTNVIGSSNRIPGTVPLGIAQMEININLSNTGSTPVTFRITLTDTGFTTPGSNQVVSFVSRFSGSTVNNSTVKFQSWYGTGNTELQLSGTTTGGTAAIPSFNAAPFSQSNSSSFTTPVGGFSLTNQFLITVNAGGNVNLTGTTEVAGIVPAPAGLVLVATAAPVLGAFGWLRRRKTVTSETAAV